MSGPSVTRRRVDQVAVGDQLGPVEVDVDRERLVAYAAASGDRNPIHWDEPFARGVGLPDVIAHGMWTMGAACELVCAWAGDPASVVGYRTKFTAPVVVPYEGGARIEVRGTVKKVVELADPRAAGSPVRAAVVELTVTCAGEKVLTRAQATVALATSPNE